MYEIIDQICIERILLYFLFSFSSRYIFFNSFNSYTRFRICILIFVWSSTTLSRNGYFYAAIGGCGNFARGVTFVRFPLSFSPNKFAQRKRVIWNLETREWAQVFHTSSLSLSLLFQFGKMSLICKHRHQITSGTGHANFVIGNEKLVCRMGNLGSGYFTLIYRRTVNVINYSFQ